jgi:hypothetical protein
MKTDSVTEMVASMRYNLATDLVMGLVRVLEMAKDMVAVMYLDLGIYQDSDMVLGIRFDFIF